mgnify:CR=1 FL=1
MEDYIAWLDFFEGRNELFGVFFWGFKHFTFLLKYGFK